MERDEDDVTSGDEEVISTHTLTWSVTRIWNLLLMMVIDFNSHAHVERDLGYILSIVFD